MNSTKSGSTSSQRARGQQLPPRHAAVPRFSGQPGGRKRTRGPRRRAVRILGLAAILVLALVGVILVSGDTMRLLPVLRPSRMYLLRSEPEPALVVMDTAMAVVASVAVGANPRAVTFSADGRTAYVTAALPDVQPGDEGALAQTGIWIVDTATWKTVDTIAIGYAVWDVATSPRAKQLVLTYQPTGRYLQATGPPHDPQMVERPPGQLLSLDLTSHKATRLADLPPLPRSIAVTPDGKLAFVVGHDAIEYDEASVTIVDIATRRTLKTITVTGAECIKATPDGRRVFAASVVEPYIWAIDRATLQQTTYRVAGIRAGQTIRDLAISADGSLLAMALMGDSRQPGGLIVLDARNLNTLLVHPSADGYQAVAFAPDHQYLYAVAPTGRLDMIEIASGRIMQSRDVMGTVRQIVWN